MSSHQGFCLHPLDGQWVDAAIALDQNSLGGLWTKAGYHQEIERDNGICYGISNEKSELLAMGFVWVILDEAHLISVAVDPKFQRQGFGTLILTQLLLQAIGRSCERSTLEVKASNRGAIRLYEHLNFKSLGIRPNYYGKGEDAVIYWLNQLQHRHTRSFLKQTKAQCQNELMNRGIELLIESD